MGDERYYVDIGGFLYVSTYKTLKKSPYLENMLPIEPTETPFFVDRDGNAFYYILNFLRNGSVHVSSEDRSFIEFLMGEAQFFGLRKMESQLGKMLEKKKRPDLNDVLQEFKAIAETFVENSRAQSTSE